MFLKGLEVSPVRFGSVTRPLFWSPRILCTAFSNGNPDLIILKTVDMVDYYRRNCCALLLSVDILFVMVVIDC